MHTGAQVRGGETFQPLECKDLRQLVFSTSDQGLVKLSEYNWDYNTSLDIITYIQGRSGEEDVCGLGYVSSMQAVMVGHIRMVVIFQCHHVGHKRIHGDLKCL